MTTFFLLILLASCGIHRKSYSHDPASVERAMQNYDRLIMQMNPDSIASIFTTDGELGKVAHGRDSISKSLARYAGFKVLSQYSTTRSIIINQDTAIQSGNYQQKTIILGNDTIAVKGSFTATWLFKEDAGWQLRRMETIPQ